MPSNLVELRHQRNTVATEMRALHEKLEDKEWRSEDKEKWNEMKSSIESLDDKIQREEYLHDQDQRYLEDNEHEHRESGNGGGESPEERQAAAFDTFLRDGFSGLNSEQRQIIKEMRAQGTTPDEKGGFTVPREFQKRVFETMKAYGGVANISNVIVTDTGREMDWPTSDGTSEEGELIGENAEAKEQDIAYGSASVGAKKLTSKIIRVSNELLQDSGIDIAGHITGRIGTRIGRGEAKYLVRGTGAGTPLQPKGLETSVTKTAKTESATDLDWKDMLALKHAVDPAYRNTDCRWLLNDKTFQAISEMEDNMGRPLYLPGIIDGAPSKIFGFQYQIDQAVADMAKDKKFLYFGDFKRFLVRRVSGMSLKRLTERYAEFDQVAFLAFMRFDCLLEDVDAIKALELKAASS